MRSVPGEEKGQGLNICTCDLIPREAQLTLSIGVLQCGHSHGPQDRWKDARLSRLVVSVEACATTQFVWWRQKQIMQPFSIPCPTAPGASCS